MSDQNNDTQQPSALRGGWLRKLAEDFGKGGCAMGGMYYPPECDEWAKREDARPGNKGPAQRG